MDFFSKLFGNWNNQPHDSLRRTPETNDNFNTHKSPDEQFPRKNFDVFTDPMQMHQYFEQEMSEILKQFGFQHFGEFSFGMPNVPSLEEPVPHNSQDQDVRDQFLKKGYDKPALKNNMKVDKDLDDKISSGNLNSFLDGNLDIEITPQERPASRNFSFGRCQRMKTVVHGDGSIETHSTVKDNEGNEETSVCHRLGDKEYCVTKLKDKSGNERVMENFVNIDESQKDIFSKRNRNIPITEGPPSSQFPFDKFFR